MDASLSAQTAHFRALHGPGEILVLPNAWDAASARIAEDCGAKAIATSSAAVAWAHGHADGQSISGEMLLETARMLRRVVRVPVSVDSEAGYAANPEEVAAFVGR